MKIKFTLFFLLFYIVTNAQFSDNKNYLNENISIQKINGKFSFINKKNNPADQNFWDSITPFVNDYAIGYQNGKVIHINKNGKAISSKRYDAVNHFNNGLALVYLNGFNGYINEKGKEIIPLIYSNASNFYNNTAAVCFDDKWIVINSKGKYIADLQVEDYDKYFENKLILPTKKRTQNHAANTNYNFNKISTSGCPVNLDFENGNFQNWETDTGHTYSTATQNFIVLPSNTWIVGQNTINRQMIQDRVANPAALDYYGRFSIHPPNTSRYSLKLGSDADDPYSATALPNAKAEAVRYVIVPPDSNYSITFSYAVVFENPAHTDVQQPRFRSKLYELGGDTIVCASFNFVASGPLPGFDTSIYVKHPGAIVKYKDWSSVYVNLGKYAGKTLYLEFTTADCTLKGHFGYAYIDVNECGITASSDYKCGTPNVANLNAPPGFQLYNWYDSTFTTLLGSNATLVINNPIIGTKYHVVLTPYSNTGCTTCNCGDTLSVIVTTNFPIADAGPDKTICKGKSVVIGTTAVAGNTYQWTPAIGLSNAQIANPIVTATNNIRYFLTVSNINSGCSSQDSVDIIITPSPIPSFTINQSIQCSKNNSFSLQNTTPNSNNSINFLWDFGDENISTLTNPIHQYASVGNYSIKLIATNQYGCSDSITQSVVVKQTPTPNFSTNNGNQCLTNNNFQFTINSNNNSVANQYTWNFDDGNLSNEINPSHSFALPGTYHVKLIATSNNGCTDSINVPINVYAIPHVTTIVSKNIFCAGDSAQIIANALPGSGNIISYEWYKNGTIIPGSNTNMIKVKQSGKYYVSVTNSNGCSNNSIPDSLTLIPLPLGSILPPSTYNICAGNPVILSATQGFNYQWYKNEIPIPAATSNTYPAYDSGKYTVKFTNQYGCVSMASNLVALKLISKPIADFNFTNSCKNTPVNLMNLSSGNNSGGIKYDWNFGDGNVSNLFSPQHTYERVGNYTIKLFATSTICSRLVDSISKTISIVAPPSNIRYPTVNAVVNKPQQLQARKIGNTYKWQPYVGLNNTNIDNPIFLYNNNLEYLITIQQPTGCKVIDTCFVKIFKEAAIYVPKAWSPNNDGHNDKLYPIIVGMIELKKFRIFNRWGVLVFETSINKDGWNGIYNNAPQPNETYTWILEAVDQYGNQIKRNGNSVLMR